MQEFFSSQENEKIEKLLKALALNRLYQAKLISLDNDISHTIQELEMKENIDTSSSSSGDNFTHNSTLFDKYRYRLSNNKFINFKAEYFVDSTGSSAPKNEEDVAKYKAQCIKSKSPVDEKSTPFSKNEIDALKTIMEESYKEQDVADWEHVANLLKQKFNKQKVRKPREVQMYWQSHLNPAVNKSDWKKDEELKLLNLAGENEECYWEHIAKDLNSNRTTWDCFTHYQQALNDKVVKSNKEWTYEEDLILKKAIAEQGEDFDKVALFVQRRTARQCQYRWKTVVKPLHQGLEREWTVKEEMKLCLAMKAYGKVDPGKVTSYGLWSKISEHFPTKSQLSIHEKFNNSLDPKVRFDDFSEAEHQALLSALEKYGHGKWAKIAKDMPGRTDAMCKKEIRNLVGKQKFAEDTQKKQEKGLINPKSSLQNKDFIDIGEVFKDDLYIESIQNICAVCKDPNSPIIARSLCEICYAEKYQSNKLGVKKKQAALSSSSNANQNCKICKIKSIKRRLPYNIFICVDCHSKVMKDGDLRCYIARTINNIDNTSNADDNNDNSNIDRNGGIYGDDNIADYNNNNNNNNNSIIHDGDNCPECLLIRDSIEIIKQRETEKKNKSSVCRKCRDPNKMSEPGKAYCVDCKAKAVVKPKAVVKVCIKCKDPSRIVENGRKRICIVCSEPKNKMCIDCKNPDKILEPKRKKCNDCLTETGKKRKSKGKQYSNGGDGGCKESSNGNSNNRFPFNTGTGNSATNATAIKGCNKNFKNDIYNDIDDIIDFINNEEDNIINNNMDVDDNDEEKEEIDCSPEKRIKASKDNK